MRVLFTLGNYHPYASANSVCVSRIQKALQKKGIMSDVIAWGETSSGRTTSYGKVYCAKMETFDDLKKHQRYLAFLRYPVCFPNNIKAYEDAIDRALSENAYDAIIAVLKPLDGAIATSKYTNLLIYELDSITNNFFNNGIRRVFYYRTVKIERELYHKSKAIFHMLPDKSFYQQSKYNRFLSKSTFLDIPQLIDEKIPDRSASDATHIKILYSGALVRKMRSPEYAITLMKELMSTIGLKLEVNFYSRGDYEDMIDSAQRDTNGIIHKRGYVALEELNEAVGETDFLLSIGNKLTGQVKSLPSKVISYMAYGKPIIHIDSGDNDIAKEYLTRYPLVLVIDPNCDLQDNLNALNVFLTENIGKRVSFEVVKSLFAMNTPEYTADCIERTVSTVCSGIVEKKEK